MAGADHRLLHDVGRVFRHGEPGLGRHQHGDAARLAELERRRRVGVDEGRLDRRLVRPVALDHLGQPVVNDHQPRAEVGPLAGLQRAAGDVNQPVADAFHQAPAGAAEPGIDTEDANRLRAHGSVDSPAPRLRLGGLAAMPAIPLARGGRA